MSDPHLTPGILQAVLRGDHPAGELVTTALRHLRQVCPDCRAAMEAAHHEHGLEGDSSAYGGAYERALARALDHTEQLRREKRTAARHLEKILQMPPEERLSRVQTSPETYRGTALAELLLEAAQETLADRPRETYAFAQLARATLQHCHPSLAVIETYVRALAHMANALRVMGKLSEADERFDHARFLLRTQEADDRLLQAELDHLEGSLRRDQRRLREAVDLLAQAISTYREEAMQVEEVRALLTLSSVLHEIGDPDRAIASVQTALAHLQSLDQPRLQLIARHNLIWYLQAAERYTEARDALVESRSMYRRFPDASIQRRLRWLEGRIAQGLGEVAEAEQALLEVRDGFLKEGMSYDAALAALDLAALYLQQQRSADVQRLAREIVPIFDAEDIHREALAALMLFQDAAQMEQLNLHFVRELAHYLQIARRNPTLTFRQPS